MLPEIPECDLLLIGGDVCPDYFHDVRPDVGRFSKGEDRQAEWLIDHFQPWLEEVPAETIVGIAGNHDFVFEISELAPKLPWRYLQDSAVEIDGLLIHGLPWVPNLPFWAFHGTDRALQVAYEQVPTCDVLLSHGPPMGYLDFVVGAGHTGSVAAYDAIGRCNPAVYVTGHIHEGFGEQVIDETRVLNVSHVNEFYEPVHPPVQLDL